MATTRQRSLLRSRSVAPHATLGLGGDDLLDLYFVTLLARSTDERMWVLNRAGRAPFVISCQGHEVAQVGIAWAIRRGKDFVFPYYRDLAVMMALGMTPREAMLNLLARADDPNSGGRQMPMHWSSLEACVPSQSSPTGTQVPQAAGTALAAQIRGDGGVSWCFFGDGATSQGDFHEGVNFAAVQRLPVVFVCEANGLAISEKMDKQMAVKTVAARAAAYGIPGVGVDGGDMLAVYRAARDAAERARRGEGPTLIEARVRRLTPHSSDDDGKYRKPEEVALDRKHDGIHRFRRYLQEHGILSADQERRMRDRITAMIDDATDYAESAPLPDASTVLDHVYGPSRAQRPGE